MPTLIEVICSRLGQSGSVVRYLVRGDKPVDVMTVSSVHPDLFNILRREASTPLDMGTAGKVRAVTREGYFVLAIMIGRKGFAREKEDPMLKVREGWALVGAQTNRGKVERILSRLGIKNGLDRALERGQ